MRLSLFRRTPEPDHFLVPTSAGQVRVALKRRAGARRMTLRVATATGEVVLSLPERADLAAAERFAQAHGGWIAARLAKRPGRVPFAAGAMLPLRGEPHRIVHWSSVRGLTAPRGMPMARRSSPFRARRRMCHGVSSIISRPRQSAT